MRIIKYLFVGLLLGSVSSCSDYLDVNDDPNRSTTAPPSEIFTGALVGYSNNRTIDLGPALSTAAQLWSGGGSFGAGVFTGPERYIFSVFTTGNTWRGYYRDIQKDLLLVIKDSEGKNNAIAQCEILSALTFYSTTVLWGDVPYSEALNIDFDQIVINNTSPAFDPQQQVLEGVLAKLDNAIALIDPSIPNSITSGDLLYGGDMVQWRKFAKSLKLRTLMTMVDADPSKEGDIATLVAEGDFITSSADNAEMPFFNVSGNRNPFWETLNQFAGGSNFFYFGSQAMVDLMQGLNDPRLETHFTVYPGGDSDSTTVRGAPPGVADVTAAVGSTPWVLSTSVMDATALVRPDAPDVLFSAQETHYLIAEAIARGIAAGSLADADQFLKDGIRIAMAQFGIADAAVDSYLVDNVGDLSATDAETARVRIAEQHFIDCIIRPVEGWTNWRRTEVPTLQLPEGAQTGSLIRRLPLPPDEVAANNNAPAQQQLDVKMWFDK